VALVAVVSGRPVAFLEAALPAALVSGVPTGAEAGGPGATGGRRPGGAEPGGGAEPDGRRPGGGGGGGGRVVLVGQHGLERSIGGRREVDPRVADWRSAVAAAAREAEAARPELVVERKGGVAFNLHWRLHPERAAEGEALGRRLAERHGLAAFPMRMGIELRPPVPVDKGTVVEELAAGHHAALFAGDDHGDLAGFAALDRLVAAGRLDHAVRVAVRSEEAPAALLEAADHQVDGPAGLAALLARIAAGAGADER
jgi:trehalose-phosphatase